MDSPAVVSQTNVYIAIHHSSYERPAGTETEHNPLTPLALTRSALTYIEVVNHSTHRHLRDPYFQFVVKTSCRKPVPHGMAPKSNTILYPRTPTTPTAIDNFSDLSINGVLLPGTGLILVHGLIKGVTHAISAPAQISEATQYRTSFRIHRDQHVVVVSAPDLNIANSQRITPLEGVLTSTHKAR